MTSSYCHHCDKSFNHIFKRRHIKSKSHLYNYYNIIINKYNIGNVYWSYFENIIHDYIKDFDNKFYSCTILVKCKLDNEILNISVDNIEGFVFLYRFKDIGSIFYEYCQSKKVRDYVYHFAKTKDINLNSSSIINNVIITIYSKYKTMTPKHRLTQPKSVLDLKLLKYISNLPFNDKFTKYKFLTTKYELLYFFKFYFYIQINDYQREHIN